MIYVQRLFSGTTASTSCDEVFDGSNTNTKFSRESSSIEIYHADRWNGWTVRADQFCSDSTYATARLVEWR